MAGFVVMDITQEMYDELIRDKAIDEFMDKIREQKKTVSACEGDKYLTGVFNGLQQALQIAENMKSE